MWGIICKKKRKSGNIGKKKEFSLRKLRGDDDYVLYLREDKNACGWRSLI